MSGRPFRAARIHAAGSIGRRHSLDFGIRRVSFTQKRGHLGLKFGEDIRFEPGIPTQPVSIARTGVWQGKEALRAMPPLGDAPGHGTVWSCAEIISLRVRSHQECEPQSGQDFPQRRVPQRCALRPGRGVASAGQRSGEAHAGGDDCDATVVVESGAVDVKPESKAVPAWVVPSQMGIVCAASWRLPDDEQARRRRDLEEGPRRKGQVSGAIAAGERRGGPLLDRFYVAGLNI